MAEYYRISGGRLKGFADQVRRISGVEGELTPAQIEEALSGVELGGIPENARLYYVSKANSEFSLNFESSATGALQEG